MAHSKVVSCRCGKILTLIKVILLALVSAGARALRITTGLVATTELRGETGEFVHVDVS